MNKITFIFFVIFSLFAPAPGFAAGQPSGAIIGECPPPLPLLMNLDYSYCRALAWMNALEKAAPLLPAFTSLRLWEIGFDEALGKQALAGLLFPAQRVVSGTSGKVSVYLKPEGHLKERTLAIFKDPQMLALEMIIILEMRIMTEEIDREWPQSLADVWQKTPNLEKFSNTLDSLWELASFLPDYGKPLFNMPVSAITQADKGGKSAVISLFQARAQLENSMFQAALGKAEDALKLSENLATRVGREKYILLWELFASYACYLRGAANWRQNQPALAEVDLGEALRLLKSAGLETLGAHIFIEKGKIRAGRHDISGMCENFLKACALGECNSLAEARDRGECIAR